MSKKKCRSCGGSGKVVHPVITKVTGELVDCSSCGGTGDEQ